MTEERKCENPECDNTLSSKQKRFCCDKCRYQYHNDNRVYYYMRRKNNNLINNNIQNKKYYVYLAIRKDAPDIYKVGYTQNMSEREKGLSSFFKTDFKIIAFIKRNNKNSARHLEKNIHRLFNKFHTDREFFCIKTFSPANVFNRIGNFIKPLDPWDNKFKEFGFFRILKSEILKSAELPF